MKFFKKMLLVVLIITLVLSGYFFLGSTKPAEKITWGVNFSQKQAFGLGLDWQEIYLALLNDLGVKNLKLAVHWDLIESQEQEYSFEDIDWQIEKAEKAGAKVVLVIGMKTSRWPECHLPGWAKDLDKAGQQEKILDMLEKVVVRYKNSTTVIAWQVENEPFFPFGECSWVDKNFLKTEIDLVKSLDSQKRQVIVTDSGEGSLWIAAAKLGDVVGTTMYKKVWQHQLGFYFTWPFPAVFYHRKAEIIKRFFGKSVICAELQAEPWSKKSLVETSLEEQKKTMDPEQFRYIVTFASNTGLDQFYLWGAEWWYWMKEKQGQPEIWQEAKKLFN
jgi:hypothetical protein